MFLDKVKITIKAGNGGNGCVSFYRSKQTMNGGPDGGDGGSGGNIIFVASNNQNTLYNFKFKRKFVADNGLNGSSSNKTGASGKDVLIDVPCGTVISDAKTGMVIADLKNEGEMFTALKGGLGGHGNSYFATSTRQAPRFSQTGEVVPEREVVLELKTIADVGLVGFPNVGKSTLLSVISNARPKIASYAFTTLVPNLGVVQYYENSFVVADIPGLIEGASEGVGLGHDFLKHVERVRIILHLIDISESEGRTILDDYQIINTELKKYSEKLSKLPQIVVFTKTDLLSPNELAMKMQNFILDLKKAKKQVPEIIAISSIMQSNLEELKKAIWEKLKVLPKENSIEIQETNFDKRDKTSIEIKQTEPHHFVVEGGYVDNLVRGIVLSDFNSFAYFQMRLKRDGIIEKLKDAGLQEGDTVKIKDIEFVYEE